MSFLLLFQFYFTTNFLKKLSRYPAQHSSFLIISTSACPSNSSFSITFLIPTSSIRIKFNESRCAEQLFLTKSSLNLKIVLYMKHDERSTTAICVGVNTPKLFVKMECLSESALAKLVDDVDVVDDDDATTNSASGNSSSVKRDPITKLRYERKSPPNRFLMRYSSILLYLALKKRLGSSPNPSRSKSTLKIDDQQPK